jgi:hypothetical protein
MLSKSFILQITILKLDSVTSLWKPVLLSGLRNFKIKMFSFEDVLDAESIFSIAVLRLPYFIGETRSSYHCKISETVMPTDSFAELLSDGGIAQAGESA